MRHCIDDFMDLLLACDLFTGLSRQSLANLLGSTPDIAPYAQGCTLRAPGPGVPLLSILLTGSALVYKGDARGRRLLMNRLGPGSTLGISTLFAKGADFPTEIIAEQDGCLLNLPQAQIGNALAREPQLALNYITLLSGRVCFLNRRIDALCVDDLTERLMRLLRSFAAEQGDGGACVLPVSLSQLAEMLGVGRASLYRALDALAHGGRIQRNGRHIILPSEGKHLPALA